MDLASLPPSPSGVHEGSAGVPSGVAGSAAAATAAAAAAAAAPSARVVRVGVGLTVHPQCYLYPGAAARTMPALDGARANLGSCRARCLEEGIGGFHVDLGINSPI